MPRILPVDPRRLAPLEKHRNHRGNGGGGAADGAFPADDSGRQNVCGEIRGGVSVARPVHAVGIRAADEKVRREIAGSGADVRL